MRNFSTTSVAAALALGCLALSIACGASNKKTQADQLAALDSAYQSGVFTKEEYDAKKAAIAGQAAVPTASVVPAPATQPTAASEPSPQPAVPPPAAEQHPIASAVPLPDQQPVPPPQTAPVSQSAPTSPVAPRPKPMQPAPVAKASPPVQAEPEPAPSKSCEDAEYKSHKDGGSRSRFFPMPVARVKKATLDALSTLDFTVHKDDGNKVEASKKRHIGVVVGAGGEREILQFEDATEGGQRGTRVSGETKKSAVGRLAQKSWTAAVLAQTACNLR
jgi:hypothetical protein